MNMSLPPVDREKKKKKMSLQTQAKVNINADPGRSRRQGHCANGVANSCVQMLNQAQARHRAICNGKMEYMSQPGKGRCVLYLGYRWEVPLLEARPTAVKMRGAMLPVQHETHACIIAG